MNLGTTDLNLLHALAALLEEGNVTRAGARVGMAQPAMSGVLGRFRRHYDDELLVRVGREHELTPLARSLLPQVQEALDLVRAAMRVGEDFDPATSERRFSLSTSDYVQTVVGVPLRRRVAASAPGVRLDLVDLSDDVLGSERALISHDVLVGPVGYGFPGEQRLLFTDRVVCVVDRDNPHLRDGRLDAQALRVMPHAVAVFPGSPLTPVDQMLSQLGDQWRVAVRTRGFLPLVHSVGGTDVVGFVPERLARRCADDGRLLVLDPPVERVDLLEAVWWHRSREGDPGHRWLLGVLDEVARELEAPPR